MKPSRNTVTARTFIAALSVVMILVSLLGCSKATKPKEVKYNLYVGATRYGGIEDSTYSRIYIYDADVADSLNLIDSIAQAGFINDLQAVGHPAMTIDLKHERNFHVDRIGDCSVRSGDHGS